MDLSGVFANAMLGGIIARRANLDPIGFAVLALLSGLGGGLIRDTLLQAGPPAALRDYAYLATALAGALAAFVVGAEGRWWRWSWPGIDALALGTWAATGAQKASAVGLPWSAAVLIGTISAVGGGMVRDIVMRKVPTILGGNTLYATCAVAAAATTTAFRSTGQTDVGLLVATSVGAVLCLAARWRGWILPSRDAWARRLPSRGNRPASRTEAPPRPRCSPRCGQITAD